MGSPGRLCRTQLVRARMRVEPCDCEEADAQALSGLLGVFFFALIRSSQTWSSHCGPVPFFFFFHGFGPGEEVTACDHGIVSPGLQPTLP